jgi:hydroxymethylpyrimidine/phosphomethylpyrimidine kinase
MIASALSIAGSDPSGGAGIQADLKAFSANKVYGMSVITALTAQNTIGVRGVHVLPAPFVAEQIHAILDDIHVDAIKIGMMANAEIIEAIADSLQSHQHIPVVLDPVMIAKGGRPLLEEKAVARLKQRLFPLTDLLTPNLPEAASLLGVDIAKNREEIELQGKALLKLGVKAVLMKGGHFSAKDSPDVLISKTELQWFEGQRIATKNTHGTGCTLSATLAAELAKGETLENAVRHAKSYLLGAIQNADRLNIGSGHGPTHHFYRLWNGNGDDQ